MGNDIYIIGEIGWETDLATLIASVEKTDRTKPLNIHIHSCGGSVYDGLAIYNYLKGLDQEVNTMSSGLVASIASIIFLAGKKENRTVNKTDSFLIHLPSNFGGGTSEDLTKTVEELKKIEDQISDIYAKETDLTKDEAMELMKKDDFLTVDFLKEKGFVSEIIEFKAVARLGTKTDNEMAKKNVTKDEVEDIFTTFFNKYFPGKTNPTNKIVTDATGDVSIDFTELDTDATPANGDTAEIDGSKAEGEFLMPSGETFKFVGGVLEIVPVENEDDTEALQARITELESQLSTAKASITEQETLVATKETELTNVKEGFKAFKAEVTSKFDYDGKKKKEEPGQEEGRSLFKKE